MFDAMDENKDGKISHDEMKNFFAKQCCCCPEKCKAAFDEADVNKDGKLDFEEFCTLMKKKMMEKHKDCLPKEGEKCCCKEKA